MEKNQEPRKVAFKGLLNSSNVLGMKIRLASIRDRWLMNIRPYDYEIYVLSSFLLLITKKEIEFIRDTGMNELIAIDAANLEGFIEY